MAILDKELFDRLWNTIEPSQDLEEFKWTLERIEALKPKIILEIGIFNGGTLQYWWELVKDGGILICIDPKPQQKFFNKYIDMPSNFHFLPMYSNDPNTVETVRKILGDQKIDYIHIDGDHDIPHLDYENYIGLLRDNGMISFHDINFNVTGPIVHYLLNSYHWDREYNFTAMTRSRDNHGVAVMWKSRNNKFNVYPNKDISAPPVPYWFRVILEQHSKIQE